MYNRVIQEDLEDIISRPLPWESLSNKTVLITGAAGLLPAYMVETILYLNHRKGYNTKVLALVRNLDNARKRFDHHQDNPFLHLVQHDICLPYKTDEPIHYIIHAASQAQPKQFGIDPVGTILPNVVGTNHLLSLAFEKNVDSFLFFSTFGVYGYIPPEQYPLSENNFGSMDPMVVNHCYLESKRMGENLCASWLYQYGVPVKVVRPLIVYGPGLKSDDGRSFADFITKIVRGQDIELYSSGLAKRSYCYIADATAGFYTVLLKGQEGEAYNVGDTNEISVFDLAHYLTDTVFADRGLKVVRKEDPNPASLRVQFDRSAADVSKLKALGWDVHFSLEDGFRRSVESILINTAT